MELKILVKEYPEWSLLKAKPESPASRKNTPIRIDIAVVYQRMSKLQRHYTHITLYILTARSSEKDYNGKGEEKERGGKTGTKAGNRAQTEQK